MFAGPRLSESQDLERKSSLKIGISAATKLDPSIPAFSSEPGRRWAPREFASSP